MFVRSNRKIEKMRLRACCSQDFNILMDEHEDIHDDDLVDS